GHPRIAPSRRREPCARVHALRTSCRDHHDVLRGNGRRHETHVPDGRRRHKHEHGGCPMMSEMKTASSAKVEETPAGARIVFTATNPAELAALRESVRAEAQHMRAGCPMAR